MENWQAIEAFMTDTWLGHLITGVLGSGILLIILWTAGKTWKGVKLLRVFYREGWEQVEKEICDSPEGYHYHKVMFDFTRWMSLVNLMVLASLFATYQPTTNFSLFPVQLVIVTFFVLVFMVFRYVMAMKKGLLCRKKKREMS